MSTDPFLGMISVVIPVHRPDDQLARIRADLAECPEVELIIVLNGEAVRMDLSPSSNERVVRSPRPGRGYALVEGASQAEGDVVLFLHSDTTLPGGWDLEVRDIMGDSELVGGAFSLSFDTQLVGMKAMALLSDVWLNLTGDIWGDRAMFVRSDVLKECIGSMDVPIFEDVRLSRQMRGRGKVKISPKKVVTSWDAFRRNGMIGHLWLIVKCHYWYIVGWDPAKIYERYYR
jgi:glycosyltransferase involved in cell wall biosynthesis